MLSFTSCTYPSIRYFYLFLFTHCSLVPLSSSHCARSRLHPGKVTSPSKGIDIKKIDNYSCAHDCSVYREKAMKAWLHSLKLLAEKPQLGGEAAVVLLWGESANQLCHHAPVMTCPGCTSPLTQRLMETGTSSLQPWTRTTCWKQWMDGCWWKKIADLMSGVSELMNNLPCVQPCMVELYLYEWLYFSRKL